MALLLSSTTLLAYVVGPSPGPASSRRGAHAVMQEYKLNNMALPGPLQPLEDQLLVKTSKYDDKTSGGLFVPAAATEKPREGTVIAAGPGKPHEKSGKVIECPVKAGDLVLMSEYAGEKVDYCNEAHLLMPSTEVLGIFEGGNPVASAFKPLADNVLIELAEAATETSSGIALAGSLSEDDSPSGKAVAVGAGKVNADGAVRAAGPPSRERDARAPGRETRRARRHTPRPTPPHARSAPRPHRRRSRRASRSATTCCTASMPAARFTSRGRSSRWCPRASAWPSGSCLGGARAQILEGVIDHTAIAHECQAARNVAARERICWSDLEAHLASGGSSCLTLRATAIGD